MPTSPHDRGNGACPDPIAELLALSAEFDLRRVQWQGQLKAMLRQHQDLEARRGSVLARALRLALDPRIGLQRTFAEGLKPHFAALVDAYERNLIEWALASAHGCQKDAAGLLGLGATTLHEKMKRLGLPRSPPTAGRHRPTRRGHAPIPERALPPVDTRWTRRHPRPRPGS
jgi:Bacterial regulatory protein, Fis family